MINLNYFNSLIELVSYFTDKRTCVEYLEQQRWGNTIVCPYCGSAHTYRRGDSRHICKDCDKSFSVIQGTIFENTKVSLQKWFMAMYLISSHKKGISSCQLGRDIRVSQKTAWYMLQKIRTLFVEDNTDKLGGDIELDEVYIGGKEKWKHKSMRTPHTQGRSTATKTPVFGISERFEYKNAKGKKESMSYVRAFVVNKTDAKTLLPIVEANVEKGSWVTTDELNSYHGLSNMGYYHSVVNHGGEEYVNDNGVFTNDIEGFWSHFRRMISGCYHNISDEHLQAYINESCFRWNTRKMSESMRFAHMFDKCIGLVKPYAVLKLCRLAMLSA